MTSWNYGIMWIDWRLIDMEFRSAIVDELSCVMYWCDELQDEDQIECILNSHPEWGRKCIQI